MAITRQLFGTMPDGTAVHVFTLSNGRGMEAKIIDYGGIVVSLTAPDREGYPTDVVLGYDTLEGYLEDQAYFGAIIGRFGNRIGGGRFTLDGVEYKLALNDGENHLHGGIKGFNRVIWDAEIVEDTDGQSLRLSYLSADGEEGYPGNLSVVVTYALTEDNGLHIEYEATTDKPTVVNLTNHSYFNLSGTVDRTILDHQMTIAADHFTPGGPGLIPTGELRSVAGTPLDFTMPAVIGARINADDIQLERGLGYDHNWVLNRTGEGLEFAARVREPLSGRVMEVHTTEPGIQFYSGNFMTSTKGKAGKTYEHRYGLCLETQHYPDSPNRPEFPSTVLRPSETYRQTTIYSFSTD